MDSILSVLFTFAIDRRKGDRANFLGVMPAAFCPHRCSRLKLPRFRGALASLVDYASVGWTSIACS